MLFSVADSSGLISFMAETFNMDYDSNRTQPKSETKQKKARNRLDSRQVPTSAVNMADRRNAIRSELI